MVIVDTTSLQQALSTRFNQVKPLSEITLDPKRVKDQLCVTVFEHDSTNVSVGVFTYDPCKTRVQRESAEYTRICIIEKTNQAFTF